MSENKTDFAAMKEELFYSPKHGCKVLSTDEVVAADA